jgi:2-polyprenyl-3-methyl-5-hydroxy-6-metoxy-1,4-benzoquinol methylase
MEQVSLLPEPTTGPVADLGAGNGRSSVFLASRGYVLHCFDRLPDALELCQDRARRSGVALSTYQQNLMKGSILEGAPFSSILMLRFVDKGLLGELGAWLIPGGVVMVHTYSTPSTTKGPGGGGPQKARYLLSPGEVGELLPESAWEFLHRSQIFEHPGKAMIGFVARRR